MAAFPAVPATFALGFRRPDYRAETPAIPALRPRRKVTPTINHSFRLMNAIGFNTKRRVPTVAFASDKNPSTDPDASKDEVNRSSSGGSSGPPLLTVLAGVVVFLLECWVVGSAVMWLVSLIMNALLSS